MKKLICCCIIMYVTVNVFSQDTITKKDVVTISPISLLDAKLSLSFYRTYKPYGDIVARISLRPSLIFVKNLFVSNYDYDNEILGNSFIIRDPFWYYNRLATEAGFSFHRGPLYIEPMMLFEFAYYKNLSMVVDDQEGLSSDKFWRLNSSYEGIGTIVRFGVRHEYKHFWSEPFLGLGFSLRFYRDKIHQIYYWNNYKDNVDMKQLSRFTRTAILIRIGYEIGFKF